MSEPTTKKVRAIARGFRGRLIEPGEVFEVPVDLKLEDPKDGGWMVPAESDIQPPNLPAVPQLAGKQVLDPVQRLAGPGVPPVISPKDAGNLSVI